MLLPLLLLIATFLAGSLQLVALAQKKTALESRLDVCAVRLATSRENTLKRLAEINAGLRINIKAIYAARAALASGIGAAAAAASLPALMSTNRGLALLEQGFLLQKTALEASLGRCASSHFSREPALCTSSPPLPTALRREKTLYADVLGPYVHLRRSEPLAKVRCWGGPKEAKLSILGDADLKSLDYRDEYN